MTKEIGWAAGTPQIDREYLEEILDASYSVFSGSVTNTYRNLIFHVGIVGNPMYVAPTYAGDGAQIGLEQNKLELSYSWQKKGVFSVRVPVDEYDPMKPWRNRPSSDEEDDSYKVVVSSDWQNTALIGFGSLSIRRQYAEDVFETFDVRQDTQLGDTGRLWINATVDGEPVSNELYIDCSSIAKVWGGGALGDGALGSNTPGSNTPGGRPRGPFWRSFVNTHEVP